MRKLLFATILTIAITVSIYHFSYAQQKDAIGVRVMQNPDHFPVAIWYQKQGFKGSPAPIQVDGYDGLQDGNTIYVNAINVERPDINNFEYASGASFKPNFYTNIYVISFNDKAGAPIKNVYQQIIKNWKFNTNINIKTLSKSQQEIDEIKEKLRRDARRLADVAYMQYVLEQYQKAYKKYPTLGAGTYLAGETMSKWPSWQETFGQELGITVPKDPINSFYPFEECPAANQGCYCQGYDTGTCWDQKTKLFNGRTSIAGGIARIGAASAGNDYTYTVGGVGKTANLSRALVYYYKSYNNGSSYDFNAAHWESPYIGGEYVVKMQTTHSAQNIAPIIQPVGNIEIAPGEIKTIEMRAYDYNKFTGGIIWTAPVLKGTNKATDKLCSALLAEKDVAQKNVEDKKAALQEIMENENATDTEVATAQDALTEAVNASETLKLEQCCIAAVFDLNVKQADKFSSDRFISYKNLKITAGNTINCAGKINLAATDEHGGVSAPYVVNVIVKTPPPYIKGLAEENKGIAGYSFSTEVLVSNSPKSGGAFSWQVNKGTGCLQDLTLATDKKIGGLSLNYAAGKLYIEGIPSEGGLYCLNISAQNGNIYNAKITVYNKPPNIADGENIEAVVGKVFEFTMNADDNGLYPEIDNHAHPQNPIIFSVLTYRGEVLGQESWISCATENGIGKFSVTAPAVETYKFIVKATDNNGASSQKEITLRAINHPPKITKVPESSSIRAGENFTGKVEASDEDGHNLTYSLSIKPDINVFSIDNNGVITVKNSNSDAIGEYQLTVKASDEYGGEEMRTFLFKINTFCGDGVVQSPNMEGVLEVCDGNNGIASSPETSSKEVQYGCSECTPAGGWCGDGAIQKNDTEECDDGNSINDDGCNNNCTCHPSTLDLVFVLDDTGSMGSSIASLKDNIIAIANQLKETGIDVKFGLVTFNDPVAVTHSVPFYSLNMISELAKVMAHDGGDAPELAYDGLMWPIQHFTYRSGANHKKISVLITDASAKKGEFSLENVKKAYTDNNIEIIGILSNNNEERDAIGTYAGLIPQKNIYTFTDGKQVGDLIKGALTTCK